MSDAAEGTPELWLNRPASCREPASASGADPERPRDVLRWRVGAEALRVELAEIFE